MLSDEKERFRFKLSPEKKNEFHATMRDLREEYEED